MNTRAAGAFTPAARGKKSKIAEGKIICPVQFLNKYLGTFYQVYASKY
jgi:hypothetical protein